MKNENMMLLGFLVFILAVLCGAYVFSEPGPRALPAATVPAATVPAAPKPTAFPTVFPSPSPATPTPQPESGVKQTEYGYNITYPPLSNDIWNPYSQPGPNQSY